MKFSFAVVLSAVTLVASATSEQLRAKAEAPRRLSDSVGFFASHIDENVPWCIIAGPSKGEDLSFNLCDFDAMPAEQLWSMDAEGKIMNNGTAVLCATMSDDSGKLYMDDCNIDSDNNLFSFNSTSGHIQLKSDPELCATNRGNNADVGDSIPILPCKDDSRFSFDFRASDGALIEPEGQPEGQPETAPTQEKDPSPVQSQSGGVTNFASNSPMVLGSLLLLSLLNLL